MSLIKQPSGGVRAIVKSNGRYVAGKTFPTRGEAIEWERQSLAMIRLGVDMRGGRQPVEDFISEWLEHRAKTVEHKTYRADVSVIKWIPLWLLRTPLISVRSGMVSKALEDLAATGKARSSLRRFRATLSAFFRWSIARGYLLENPALGASVPRSAAGTREMRPYSRAELLERLTLWREIDPAAAAQVEFLALTGCRWSEARELRSSDVHLEPHLAIWISRAQPEGSPVKGTKSSRGRRVPIAGHLAPWVMQRIASGDDYLMPVRAVNSLRRRLDWPRTSGGRTVHDLRHTAITLWLADRVDTGTARTWAGHTDLTTTTRYSHWLGTDADLAAITRVNQAWEHLGHTTEGRDA